MARKKNMGNRILVGICIVIAVLAVVILLAMWMMPKSKVTLEDDCGRLETQIQQLMSGANYCKADADCIAHEGFSCPFACTRLINKNADLTTITQGIAKFRQNCFRPCNALCIQPPAQQEIACINSKCIDKRSQAVQ